MANRKTKEGIVFILDVGTNMKQQHTVDKTFLDSSKECLMKIVFRKLFSNSADELGLILMGCAETKNNLASEHDSYRNIAVVNDNLTVANWDLLRYIDEIVVSENCTADWLDAIVVAMQIIKDESDVKNYVQSKIVMFSNFATDVSDDQINFVIEGLKSMNINVTVIGPDVQNEELMIGVKKPASQTDGEVLISNVIHELNETGSLICSFEQALPELMYFQRKSVRPTPWNALFTISKHIKIPIRAFKKVGEPAPMKFFDVSIDDPTALVVKDKGYIKLDDEKADEVVVASEDVIEGYPFGSSIIPFSETDKEAMQYKSGPRSLLLIGCTSKRNVPLHILMGEGSYIILSKQDDDVAKVAIEAFIDALKLKDQVGIARRVYNTNTAARIGALFPIVNEDSKYLVYAELPYAEDEHVYKFPALDTNRITKDQLNAVENLIDCMNLDNDPSLDEKYDITRMYDPQEQHQLNCLAFKGLHNSIPDNINEMAQSMLEPAAELMERCEPMLKRISEIFPIKNVAESVCKIESSTTTTEIINEMKAEENSFTDATLDQTKVLNDLLATEKSIAKVCQTSFNIISNLLNNSPDDNSLIEFIKKLRNVCSDDAKSFNQFITDLKRLSVENKYTSLWDKIVYEKLGLLKDADTAEPEEEFYRMNDVSFTSSVTSTQNTNSLDDLLNDL